MVEPELNTLDRFGYVDGLEVKWYLPISCGKSTSIYLEMNLTSPKGWVSLNTTVMRTAERWSDLDI